MGYLSLLFTLIVSSLVAIVMTYHGGIPAGIAGCVLVSLHNVWASNLILRHHFRTGITIFFQNMFVVVPIMLVLDTFFKLLKNGQGMSLKLVIYVLIAFSSSWLLYHWHDIRDFKLSEYLKKQKELRYYRKLRQKDEVASKQREQAYAELETAYNNAEQNMDNLAEFFRVTASILSNTEKASYFAYALALYCSKLITKGLEEDNRDYALTVFNHYIYHIFPYTGSDRYKSNIIGNSLALAQICSLDNVSEKVFQILLEPDFDILEIENHRVLYNLACYYATRHQKDKMLIAIRQGLLHGRDAEKYRTDEDFEAYRDDADFKLALQARNEPATS